MVTMSLNVQPPTASHRPPFPANALYQRNDLVLASVVGLSVYQRLSADYSNAVKGRKSYRRSRTKQAARVSRAFIKGRGEPVVTMHTPSGRGVLQERTSGSIALVYRGKTFRCSPFRTASSKSSKVRGI